MLHHISIAAENPLHVAEVLAEIWQGRFFPFPPHPGSYMVFACDEYGTAIEIYPSGTELTPGLSQEEVEFSLNNTASRFTATHAAISVPTSQEKIEQIGAREDWRVQLCNRGPFHVIEFWVENKLLIELLPPAIAPEYIEFAKPENLEQIFTAATLAEAVA
jgi:hypothetical protein